METLIKRLKDRYGEDIPEFLDSLGITMEDLLDAFEEEIEDAIERGILDV